VEFAIIIPIVLVFMVLALVWTFRRASTILER